MGITHEKMTRGYLLLYTNEEMGEAGLSVRSASEIERSSILALGRRSLAHASSVGAIIE